MFAVVCQSKKPVLNLCRHLDHSDVPAQPEAQPLAQGVTEARVGTMWNHPVWGGWCVNHGKHRQRHASDFCSKVKNKDGLFKEGIWFRRFWTLLSIKGGAICHCKQLLSPKPLNSAVKQELKQEITDQPRFRSWYRWKEKWIGTLEAFLHPMISGIGSVSLTVSLRS